MFTPEPSHWQLPFMSQFCLAFSICTCHCSQPPGNKGPQLPLTECSNRLGQGCQPPFTAPPPHLYSHHLHTRLDKVSQLTGRGGQLKRNSRIKAGCWNTTIYGPIPMSKAKAPKILNYSPKRACSRHAPVPILARLPWLPRRESATSNLCGSILH